MNETEVASTRSSWELQDLSNIDYRFMMIYDLYMS